MKLSLGDLISGISTYWVTRFQHDNEISKTELKRQRELIEEMAAQTEDFSSAALTYWVYMVEHVRYSKRDEKPPEDLPVRIKNPKQICLINLASLQV